MKHKTYYSEEKNTFVHEGLNKSGEICAYGHYSSEDKLIKDMDRFCYYKDIDSFEGIYKGEYEEDK